MDEVEQPSNSGYYTPPSEPFRIYIETYEGNLIWKNSGMQHRVVQWKWGEISEEDVASIFRVEE
jgi:hypothetical protein